jgi:ribosomal protein L37AE/L43A
MQLLNDMTPAEREADDRAKRACPVCVQGARRLLDRRVSAAVWTGPTHFPPRRFVHARIRITEETWWCDACAGTDRPAAGTTLSFTHVGDPSEIVPVDGGPASQSRRSRRRVHALDAESR